MLNNLNNKNIAIIGNAKSLLDKKRNIDSHDIVIRINKGSNKGKEEIIGYKTDIVALSLNLNRRQLFMMYNGFPEAFYCSPKNRDNMDSSIKKFYPLENWAVLEATLGSRPSTGCMMIDYLYNYIDFKTLHIYGFDFWTTDTWYTNNTHKGPHDPQAEEFYINNLMKNDKRIIFHE